MHSSSVKVVEAAKELGLRIEVVEFDQTTRTAADAASAIGCEVAQIVKSLVFLVAGKPVLALMAGNNRLDTRKLAAQFEVSRKKVKRADADLVKSATGFSIGGVPPLGHIAELPIYMDEDLSQFKVVWAAAGTSNAVFAIEPHALEIATQAILANLKLD
jgi:Cys-tRNA(Pro) deacylase